MLTSKEIKIGEKLLRITRNRWSNKASEYMLSRGSLWYSNESYLAQKMVHALRVSAGVRFSSASHLSLSNYHFLREMLHPLSSREKVFLSYFMATPFYALHATNNNRVINDKGDLVLYSRKQLMAKEIPFPSENSHPLDVHGLANTDYVFFSLEAGCSLKKNRSRFGKTFFKINYQHSQFSNSSMVLLDQLTLETPSCKINDLSDYCKSMLADREIPRTDIFFQGRQFSLQGLAHYIIATIRLLPDEDQNILFGMVSTNQMNNLINSFFRPEIRVPRMAAFKKGQFTVYKN